MRSRWLMVATITLLEALSPSYSYGAPERPPIKNHLSSPQLYAMAREFFNQGRFAEAIQYAAAALRRKPNWVLPQAILAQSYYRIGNVPRAAKLFRQIPIESVPPDATVDYALAMFAGRHYKSVIRIAPYVSDQNPYKDIVKFYTGVSYMQFRAFEKAQYFLRTAMRLPPALLSQRRRLLTEIDDILDSQARGDYQERESYTYQNQNNFLPNTTDESGFKYSAKPSVSYRQSSVSRNFSGYLQTQSDYASPAASVSLGINYIGDARYFGGKPTFEMHFLPSYTHSDSTTQSSALVADSTDPSSIQNQTSKTSSTTFNQTNEFGAKVFYPVTEAFDFTASYVEVHQYQFANIDNDIATKIPLVGLVLESGKFKFDLNYQDQILTAKQSPDLNCSTTITKLVGSRNGENSKATASAELLTKSAFSPDTGANAETYDHSTINQKASGLKSLQEFALTWTRQFNDLNLNLSGLKSDEVRFATGTLAQDALNIMVEKLELVYTLGFGVTLTSSAALLQLSNILIERGKSDPSDAPPEALGNGSGQKYAFSANVSPISWFGFLLSYEYATRELTSGNDLLTKNMQISNWSLQTTTSLALNFNYQF